MQDHVIDVKEAVEYLGQFEWVKDFDTVIERLLQPEEQDDGVGNPGRVRGNWDSRGAGDPITAGLPAPRGDGQPPRRLRMASPSR